MDTENHTWLVRAGVRVRVMDMDKFKDSIRVRDKVS